MAHIQANQQKPCNFHLLIPLFVGSMLTIAILLCIHNSNTNVLAQSPQVTTNSAPELSLLQPTMVKDINDNDGIDYRFPSELNGVHYFRANDGIHGSELWKSDGTSAGTTMVKDINATGNSSPFHLTSGTNALYFGADDGVHGDELWVSDGTPSGTTLLKDINTGNSSSDPYNLTFVNNTLYFVANDNTHGFELWKSDGTTSGTQMIKDINLSGDSRPNYLTPVGNEVFFQANDGIHGVELWKTDGTITGTQMVTDINPAGNSSPSYLYNLNGTLFFGAEDNVNGKGLWKSDGTTTGTVKIAVNYPDSMVGLNGELYFRDHYGRTLLKTDGTPNAVTQVTQEQISSDIININDTLFFGAYIPDRGALLWKSDGTEEGTVQVAEVIVESVSNLWESRFTNVDGKLFFIGDDAVNEAELLTNDGTDAELWTSDGTPAGTAMVKDIQTAGYWRSPLTNVNGVVFFSANDGVHRDELWKSDGTPEGTVLVKDINQTSGSSNPAYLFDAGNLLFFVANDGIHGNELWISDGSTKMVRNIDAFDSGIDIWSSGYDGRMAVMNNTVYFVGSNWSGPELWQSDGTQQGTMMRYNINTSNGGGSTPSHMTVVNNTLFFEAYSPQYGRELFKIDNTSGGIVRDITPGNAWSSIGDLVDFNGTLFFNANGELWKSDGTQDGTSMVIDINSRSLIVVGDTLYFQANDGTHGTELWKSDGTALGTTLVKDINDSGGSNPKGFVSALGKIYFHANDGINGIELWVSDGTETGTHMVKDINPNGDGIDQWYSKLVLVQDTLYFMATDDAHGKELWKSDGTEEGTVMVKNINLDGDSDPRHLVAARGLLFFAAIDGVHGNELWVSNGTEQGTFMVQDLNPTGDGISLWFGDIANVGNRLYFVGDDGIHGNELWALPHALFLPLVIRDQ